jgi:hypothetical protein
MMNATATQQEQQAGDTKLTAVSMQCNGKTHNFFVMAKHDAKGQAFIPQDQWIRLLDKVRDSSQDRVIVR